MIIQRLYGGLGNQLFQYALGRQLAELTGAELVLDTTAFGRSRRQDTAREYELWRYPLKARLVDNKEKCWCAWLGSRMLRRFSFSLGTWRIVRERGYDFDPEVLRQNGNLYLDGHWQSPHYFEAIGPKLREELTPAVPLGVQDSQVAGEILAGEAVSIHVRRGDYVTNTAAAAMHGLCSLDYYHTAALQIAERLVAPHFFVFSDDPEWTKANLVLPGQATYVTHNGAQTAFQDLRLMSLCRHHIIANSSFSWWGAWLNPSPSKSVIVPKRWFLSQETPTLMPLDWVAI